jgi:hypothetical protein
MKDTNALMKQPSLIQYVICYVVWVILAVATVWIGLQIRVNLIQMPLPFSGLDSRVVRVIEDATLIITGFILLVTMILLEHGLRTGLTNGRFWRRVASSIIALAILLGVSYGANILLMKALFRP